MAGCLSKRPLDGPSAGIAKRPASNVTKAASLREDATDSVLMKIMKRMLRKQKAADRAAFQSNLTKRLSMASACTGSGMAEVVHISAHEIYGLEAHSDFACEKVGFKQEFYRKVVEPRMVQAAAGTCHFDDIEQLGLDMSACITHRRRCPRGSRPFFFSVGFSCKDLSILSDTFTSEQRANILAHGLGSSGRTFKGLMAYIWKRKPRVVVLENVDALGDDGEDDSDIEEPNLSFIYSSLNDAGYSVAHRVFVTSNHGLPQHRRRIYIIAVLCVDFGLSMAEGRTLTKSMVDDASKLTVPKLPLASFILPSNHHLVQAELERSSLARRPLDKTATTFPALHRQFFKERGIRIKDLTVPVHVLGNAWFEALPCREKDIVLYVDKLRKARPSVCTVDSSQSIYRSPKGCSGVVQTLTPGMHTWIYSDGEREINRAMLGFEAMTLQGFPSKWLEEAVDSDVASDSQLKDLAGNAFSATVFAAIYIVLMCKLPQQLVQNDQQQQPDIDTVMRLMS